MIWQVFEIVAIIIECSLAIRFLVEYFGFKSNSYKYLKVAIVVVILCVWDYVGSMILQIESLTILGYIIIVFSFALFYLKNSIPEKLIISILSYTLFILVNLPILYFFSVILDKSAYDMTVLQSEERVLILFFSKVFYFAVTQLIISYHQNISYRFTVFEWILIISDFLITLLAAFLLYSLSINLWNRVFVYVSIVSLLAILDVIAFVFMKKISLKNVEKTENKLLKLSLQQQSDMIESIHEQYDNISEMRHNYVHELAFIQGVMMEGDYERVKHYIADKLSCEQLKSSDYVFSSNKVIDSVINYRLSEAEQNGISTLCKITAKIPKELEHDIAIILSNLLQNAVEASIRLEKDTPEVILEISCISGYYSIIVKNRIEDSVLQNNRKLRTVKKDKDRHGFGLRSIRTLANSHNGMLDIYEMEGYFIVKVLISR